MPTSEECGWGVWDTPTPPHDVSTLTTHTAGQCVHSWMCVCLLSLACVRYFFACTGNSWDNLVYTALKGTGMQRWESGVHARVRNYCVTWLWCVTSVCNIVSFHENCNTLVCPHKQLLSITLVFNIPLIRWQNTDTDWNRLLLQCWARFAQSCEMCKSTTDQQVSSDHYHIWTPVGVVVTHTLEKYDCEISSGWRLYHISHIPIVAVIMLVTWPTMILSPVWKRKGCKPLMVKSKLCDMCITGCILIQFTTRCKPGFTRWCYTVTVMVYPPTLVHNSVTFWCYVTKVVP